MDVRILGPVEVWDGGRRCELGGPRQHALLVDLLLHANAVVPADRLIDDLWGGDPSESALTALRVAISRLRRGLPGDTIVTRHPGYLIRVRPEELDLLRFERLVEDAQRALDRGSPADASDWLRRALELWRGPVLAEVAHEDFARAAIARLEEVRIAALELRIESDLAQGRHGELVGELEALAVEHPLRERLRGQLVLALYRSGRQADALDAVRQTRRLLVEELGIDPSPALQDLERAILQQDPALSTPEPPPRPGARARDPERTILVCADDGAGLPGLLALAEPLAADPARVIVLAATVPDGRDLVSCGISSLTFAVGCGMLWHARDDGGPGAV